MIWQPCDVVHLEADPLPLWLACIWVVLDCRCRGNLYFPVLPLLHRSIAVCSSHSIVHPKEAWQANWQACGAHLDVPRLLSVVS